jgi:hypothetical protein
MQNDLAEQGETVLDLNTVSDVSTFLNLLRNGPHDYSILGSLHLHMSYNISLQ